MADMTDLEAVKKAIIPGTRLVHIETPDNPTVGITDIEAIAKIACSQLITPLLPAESPGAGSRFVVDALTKFINGHGDAQEEQSLPTIWRRWTASAMRHTG